MTNIVQRGVLIAAMGLTVLTGACSAKQDTQAASAPTPTTTAADSKTSSDTKPADNKAANGQAPTAENLAGFQKLISCMRDQGVDAADPVVGTPYDTSTMDNLFSTERAKWNIVLTACPDYKKLVVGVG